MSRDSAPAHNRYDKREEFTISVSGLDIASGNVTAGQARNFISKVQDVFGSGDGGFPGDEDFIDNYAGGGLVSIEIPESSSLESLIINAKLATISLDVPYVNQNDGNETVEGVAQRGAVLCMPTSGEMLAGYWDIDKVEVSANNQETRTPLTRLHIMEGARANNTGFSLSRFPRAWQNWAPYRQTMQLLVDEDSPNTYTVGQGAAGGGNSYSVPSDYANGIKDLIFVGVPTVTSTYATDGHVMIAIGAVVKHDDEAEWIIFNDPNGTLASPHSIYGDLDVQSAVGTQRNGDVTQINRPEDVRAVQEVLEKLGHYNGTLGAQIDVTNPQDQTIGAIYSYQGANGDGRIDPAGAAERRLNSAIDANTSPKYSNVEQERNGATGDRGRHVYYNGGTEGARSGRFRIKGAPWSCVIEPNTALTKSQIRDRVIAGEILQE